jgi:GWxTD domain-containing protein
VHRIRFSHALLCGLISLTLGTPAISAQTHEAEQPLLSAPYQKWVDEDVLYIISPQERSDFERLTTDPQRDTFVRDFWERRNPNPRSPENDFKEEHYRRLAYTNQHFAAGAAGYKTDRGRIYILYGPPDEREQHPGNASIDNTSDAPAEVHYPSDVWRYHDLKGIGKDVVFEFIDKCRCGKYFLQHDPTQKKAVPRTKLTAMNAGWLIGVTCRSDISL